MFTSRRFLLLPHKNWLLHHHHHHVPRFTNTITITPTLIFCSRYFPSSSSSTRTKSWSPSNPSKKFNDNDTTQQPQQQEKNPLSPLQQRILDNIETVMFRRRRVPLRVLAAILTPEEQEAIISFGQQQKQQQQSDLDGSDNKNNNNAFFANVMGDAEQCYQEEEEIASTKQGGGLLSLILEHGMKKNGLFTTQDCAGVWYIERTFKEERINYERKITEYDATANYAEAAANPSKFSKSSTDFSQSSPPVEASSGDYQTFEQQKQEQESTEVFNAIRPFLPSGFFIPLPVLAASISPSVINSKIRNKKNISCSSSSSSFAFSNNNNLSDENGNNSNQQSSSSNERVIQDLFNHLALMKPQQVDVRVFGDKPEDVYVRSVCDNLDFDEKLDLMGEQRHSRFDIAIFAGALYSALKGKGRVSMPDLPNYLPPDLIFRLPLKQYHAILIFERMPHLFYVNPQLYVVEAKNFDVGSSSSRDKNNNSTEEISDHQQQLNLITSLLIRTSPCPSELRFIVENLTQPCPLSVVEKELPKFVRNRIKCFFASLSDFVAAHSAYLFLDDHHHCSYDEENNNNHHQIIEEDRQNHYQNYHDPYYHNNQNHHHQGPILNSHRLQQAIRDQKNAELEHAMMKMNEEYYGYGYTDNWTGSEETLSDKRKRHREQRRAAIEIAKYLPDATGIPIHVLRQRLPGELESKIFKKHPRHFFDMFPDLFNTFCLYHSPTVPFVQHVALPPPVNAVPRTRTEADVVRVLGFFCLSPRRLDVVFGCLPPEARYFIERRYGASVMRFLQKRYARFFALFPDRFTGEPSAMYVGHYPEEQRESIRRRLLEESATPPSKRID